MLDQFNRKLSYLRISVTDRCNFRCIYCMPAEGVELKSHDDILSYLEIAEVVKVGVRLGITKIRLTGGEPLVRKDIVQLVKMISQINGIEEIGMTTNGVFLSKYAKELKSAGLNRVNISLDTVDPVKFRKISRVGNLQDVLQGIDAAIEAELLPVKINFVRIKDQNLEDEIAVANFCKQKGLQLRFIRQMNLKTGEFFPVEGGDGGICNICNRLRLTADGYIVPCLHSGERFSIKELGIEQAFIMAAKLKPAKGTGTETHVFSNIGG
ncbi:MAG: radical SAM protein [Bacteroidetes bacterium CG2_30_33_31]|nr:MAG: radical SAM protein [Bacteroidetes bacterium CG2_30_33_31]